MNEEREIERELYILSYSSIILLDVVGSCQNNHVYGMGIWMGMEYNGEVEEE